jgi:hypothetical protein
MDRTAAAQLLEQLMRWALAPQILVCDLDRLEGLGLSVWHLDRPHR